MQREISTAASRGYAKHGWLTTHHSFSFASYYDPRRMGFGALRVVNDDVIAPGAGFGRHHHDNMEIITLPLSGALKHEDSMGNSAVIEAGEVQVMSAGSGVEHAEFDASSTELVTLLQIWILTEKNGVSPRYDQRRFDPALFLDTFYQIVGPFGAESLAIHQEAFLSLGRFSAGKEAVYTIKRPGNGVYFFVIEGRATIAGTALETRDALALWDTESASLESNEACFLLAIEVPME